MHLLAEKVLQHSISDKLQEIVFVSTCCMCSSQQGLFKSDRIAIDKNMTLVGKSRIVVEGRCLLLAEAAYAGLHMMCRVVRGCDMVVRGCDMVSVLK